jgi:Mo-dependent nitrogenase C-terminus
MPNTKNKQIIVSGFIKPELDNNQAVQHQQLNRKNFDLLLPIANWLDSLEVKNQKFARIVAKVIPAQCPFERDILVFGRKVGHIPPMCKLNPLYDQFVFLRFRALCYLVDECGEDIQSYC